MAAPPPRLWTPGHPCLEEQATKSRVQSLLAGPKGSVRDKLRLLGVYCLAARPSAAEVSELQEVLRQAAAESGVEGAEEDVAKGLGAIGYLRQQVSASQGLGAHEACPRLEAQWCGRQMEGTAPWWCRRLLMPSASRLLSSMQSPYVLL